MTPPDRDEHGRSGLSSDNIIGQCSKCGLPWLAGHVCGEIAAPERHAHAQFISRLYDGSPRQADPTPARTVGENVVRLVHLRNGQFYHPILSDLDHTHVAFPKDEAAEILRLAAWAREVAALMHIGLERPPEEVFEHFRRELGIEAPDAI